MVQTSAGRRGAQVSMALGILFLGGGTASLGTSNGAVAALLLALYPRLPTTPQDNRCHLQARPRPPAPATVTCSNTATLDAPAVTPQAAWPAVRSVAAHWLPCATHVDDVQSPPAGDAPPVRPGR